MRARQRAGRAWPRMVAAVAAAVVAAVVGGCTGGEEPILSAGGAPGTPVTAGDEGDEAVAQ